MSELLFINEKDILGEGNKEEKKHQEYSNTWEEGLILTREALKTYK